ncbi:hypothetical protein SteCoe_10531 [Stentor coeruleus]|uniref:2-oxoacid dehydrogenase acyltransferase catalytic domain-containing protein n=1 Tax=Stentor coeruleus TaxID=5963 RepID=A0A1R2CF82_9CILI|nr:hypothetical protein SteCoe_10531 [Stentor coeruleus]
MNALIVCAILAGIFYFLLFNTTVIYFILAVLLMYFALSWYLVPASSARFNSARRKISICTWSDPSRPLVFGHFQVRVSKMLEYLDWASKKTGLKITLNHLATKACGMALNEFPELIGKICLGNFRPVKTIDSSCLISLENGKNVYFVNTEDIPNKPLTVICDEMEKKIASLQKGDDGKLMKKNSQAFAKLPTCIAAVLGEIVYYLNGPMGIALPFLGMKKQQFGSFIISNLGMYGLETGYPPLFSVSHTIATLTLMAIHDEAIVDNSKIIVQKCMNVCVSFDHRYMDGIKAAKVQNRIKEILEDPMQYIKLD